MGCPRAVSLNQVRAHREYIIVHAHPTSRGQRAKRGGGRWRDTVWIASDGIKKRADRCSCSNRNGVGCGTRRWWETLAVSTTVRRRPTNTSSARAKGWSALPQAELGRARLLCAGTGWQLSLTPCQHASCLFMHAGAECDRGLRARHGYLPPSTRQSQSHTVDSGIRLQFDGTHPFSGTQ